MDRFLEQLRKHAIRKLKLYDGINNALSQELFIERWLVFLTEELGEVASMVNRERWNSARDECIDVAHTAMLLYISLERKIELEGKQ